MPDVLSHKQCSKCKEIKPLTEYYRHDSTKDRLFRSCKGCLALLTSTYARTPEGREVHRRGVVKYSKSVKGKLARRRVIETTRKQIRARMAVQLALASGKLVRPQECSNCRKPCKPDSHHYLGYSKEHRLHVQWLCRNPCHMLADAKQRLNEAAQVLINN